MEYFIVWANGFVGPPEISRDNIVKCDYDAPLRIGQLIDVKGEALEVTAIEGGTKGTPKAVCKRAGT